MVLFVAGESGKARAIRHPTWPWRVWAAGALLCAAHMLIAMAGHHAWSHEHAVRETATRSAAVYGFGWRGGLYVNYAFLIVWIAEIVWWRVSPVTYFRRSALVTWGLRIFYAVIIINGVVVFASPAGRAAGVGLSIWLGWVWSRTTALPVPLASDRTARSYRGS